MRTTHANDPKEEERQRQSAKTTESVIMRKEKSVFKSIKTHMYSESLKDKDNVAYLQYICKLTLP